MNKPVYKNIIFDLDGTLTDSQEGIVKSIIAALKALGINAGKEENLAKYIGIPLQELFQKHFNIPESKLESAVFHFRDYYMRQGIYENRLYPGIKEMLDSLVVSSKLFIATSKLENNALIVLRNFKIDHYFSGIAGANAAGTHSGKTYLITRLLNEYHLEAKSSIVMVGDTIMDIRAANECNIDSIAVTYGYGSLEEINAYKPTYLAHTVNELKEILL